MIDLDALEREAEAALRLASQGCCGDSAWRGHLCSYHLGYEDGLDALLWRVREELRNEEPEK